MSTHLPSNISAAAPISHARRGLVLPLVLNLLPLAAAHAQWQTNDTTPPGGGQSWVFYDWRYPTPPSTYGGAWGVGNSWPTAGTSVTIRHFIELTNNPYYPNGDPNFPVEPFPGGAVIPGGSSTRGLLTVNSLHIVPGGWLQSSLQEFAFDGVSTWSGGSISAGGGGPPGIVHNQGQLSVTGPFTIGRGGDGMLNTEHIALSSTLSIEFGTRLRNESGALPDVSVAEIVLHPPGAQIAQGGGPGGGNAIVENYGVIRKPGTGPATIAVGIHNFATSFRNRAGTIAVEGGTLLLDSVASSSTFYGLKAEIAPGALLVMQGNAVFENGDTTVTGGGVLRLLPVPGTSIQAVTGATPRLLAPEGKLECAGAEMRGFLNKGSINVTAPSSWRNMTNDGHVRAFADLGISITLQNGTPASHTAVLDLEGGVNLTGSPLHNYALLRKKGPGVSQIQGDIHVYGSADPLAGRIEVEEGTLQFPNSVTCYNGGRIRVANGAVAEVPRYLSVDGGTLTVTGSGKFQLNAGTDIAPLTPGNPAVINAAPGVFELRGGRLFAPVTNAGELIVTGNTLIPRSFNGDNPLTNSGTIRCTATSAGAGNSITLAALVRLVCTPTSVLSLDIAGGPAQADQWARIGVDANQQSSIVYDGTLRINFGSFTPTAGDRWDVIHAPGGFPPTGDFASVQFTNVPAGFTPVFQKLASGIRVGLDVGAAPKTYANWATTQSFPTPAAATFDADPDGDGFSNGLECALGTNPQSRASVPAMITIPYISGGDRFLAVRFTRAGGANRATDLQFIPERSDTLSGWTSTGVVLEVGPLDAQGNETLTVRPAVDMAHKARTFVRLRVQQMP